jgi:membrane protease YdiL (CAAX protease family)
MALGVYGLFAAGALLWGWLRGDVNLYHHPEPWVALPFPGSTLAALGSGVLVGLVVVAGTRVAVRRTGWARDLHVEFREILGPLRGWEIAVFALTSGIAEEMFFRGAMQPALGVWASSLVFGLVHVGPVKRFWVWTLWATLMGFVFAALYATTGELLAPVVAHVLINYENMHFIDAFDPNPDDASKTPEPPRLVATRRRF